MGTISTISYFKKHRKDVLKKLDLSSDVQELLDTSLFSFVKSFVTDGVYKVQIFKLMGNERLLVHAFIVNGNKVKDLTCTKNCKFLFALAMRYRWLKICSSGMPITKWIKLDEKGSYRYRLRFSPIGIYFVEYKDRYGRKLINIKHQEEILNSFFDLPKRLASNDRKGRFHSLVTKIQKLNETGNKRWLNLKQFRSVNLSRKYQKALGWT